MKFPIISESLRLERLQSPQGKIKIVIDSDTYNEIDDQFAIVYALLSSERLTVEAIYAAPFFNDRSVGPGDGMEKSYREILKILNKLNRPIQGVVFRGSDRYLTDWEHPIHSEAALDLVNRAMNLNPGELLYVVGIAVLTNIASAILIEPEIINRIVIVWLGGHPHHWHHTKEFNLKQDVLAARLLFDCGVPLVQIPCLGVASHLLTTLPEIEQYVAGRGAIGEYLAETFKACSNDHFAFSRPIWDISAIAWLVNDSWVPSEIVHSPIVTDQVTWSFDQRRHFIRRAFFVKRDPIFRDLFEKLERQALPRI
ncbi:MAG: nucleoside hydrolase [candidate division KSB1 bacterium]|nr:nucleoside hydrolase [candidate division KSB1 bacterium]